MSESKITFIPIDNKYSLVAYYTGVFAFIPILGFVLAPVALICGIIGLRRYYSNKEIKGRLHSLVGIISGLIFTIFHYGVMLFLLSWFEFFNNFTI